MLASAQAGRTKRRLDRSPLSRSAIHPCLSFASRIPAARDSSCRGLQLLAIGTPASIVRWRPHSTAIDRRHGAGTGHGNRATRTAARVLVRSGSHQPQSTHEASVSMARLERILGSIPIVSGFPRPDWERIGEWVSAQCSEDDPDEVYTNLARQWLAMVKEAVGDGYELVESDNFLILTASDQKNSAHLTRIAERALKEMVDGLPGIAAKSGYGKFVCLAFRDIDTYYEYISYFFPEGEYGATGGMYLSQGYAHFVLNHAAQQFLEPTLVHELTHACLHRHALPLWLEEGVTQVMEEAILGYSDFKMNREEVERHQKYWRENGLRCFWLGQSFSRPDDGMELSYSLAQVLTRNLNSRGRQLFLRLLERANASDCGDSATRELYGLGVGDLAAQFLGDGDWDWVPVEATDFYYRALLHQDRGEYEKALEDFRIAIGMGSDDPEHLNAFAWFLSTCPSDLIRDGKEAVSLAHRAVELSAREPEFVFDTLAAAYAELGDFEQAMKWERRALDLAQGQHRKGDERRLRLYQEGKPCRDEPRDPR
jgi:tetratricopeptide (TPR) repeat protein